MTISFTMTREQIAQRVMGKVAKIGATTVNSADAATVYQAVDLRLKEVHKLGIFWRKVPVLPLTFNVTANINSASATADIAFPISMTVNDSSRDVDVQIVGIREYSKIEDKTQTGVPTKALWGRDATFTFFPVPTVSTTAKLVYEKVADDTAVSTAPDVDVSMMRALIDIIKYDLIDDFGIPEDTAARWTKEMTQAERDIRKLSVQHVSYEPVKVDDFDNRQPQTRTFSDYPTF